MIKLSEKLIYKIIESRIKNNYIIKYLRCFFKINLIIIPNSYYIMID